MALEEKIGELIAAVKENTAALKGGGSSTAGKAAAADGKKGPGRPAGSTASKFKADDVKAALVGLKEKLGAPAAKQIISDSGADDLADLLTKKALWDDVMAAVETALSDSGDGDDGDGDDL